MRWYLPDRCPMLCLEIRRMGRRPLQKIAFTLLLMAGLAVFPMATATHYMMLEDDQLWFNEIITATLVFHVYTALFGLLLATTPFSAERARGNLQSLFLTPLSTWAIVKHKFTSAAMLFTAIVIIISGTFIGTSIMIPEMANSPAELLFASAVMFSTWSTALFIIALGLLISCWTGKQTVNTLVITLVVALLAELAFDSSVLAIANSLMRPVGGFYATRIIISLAITMLLLWWTTCVLDRQRCER